MSKLEGYSLRLALIFHCCRFRSRAKDEWVLAEDMRAAVELTGWFRDEAQRVYTLLGETAAQQANRQILEIVCRLAGRLEGGQSGFRGVTIRDLQNHNGRRFPTSKHAEAALESLVGAGLGDWVEGPEHPGGYRPRYFVPRPRPTSDISDSPPEGGGDR